MIDLNSLPGTTLDGKYEILSVAGAGGMGTVFKALQKGLNRVVAIKLLQLELTEDDESRKRFEREAQAISLLSHPNIGQFYSYGIWRGEIPIPYLVMEFVEGKSLQQILNAQDKLDWRRTIKIAIQICEGMAQAHKVGIIHRDLKPGNIILLPDSDNSQNENKNSDVVKIIDFGLARIQKSSGLDVQKLTQTGELIGSINYMSPELCTAQHIDHRSDIYSLACILYQCLCGELPHNADNSIGLMHKHVNEAVIPLDQKREIHLPPGLDAVILKGLEKDPDQRYQSMLEFETELKLVAVGDGHKTKALRENGNGQRSAYKINSSGHGQFQGKQQRKKLIAITSAIFLLAGGLLLFLVKMINTSETLSNNKIALAKVLQNKQKLSALLYKAYQQDTARNYAAGMLVYIEALKFIDGDKDFKQRLKVLSKAVNDGYSAGDSKLIEPFSEEYLKLAFDPKHAQELSLEEKKLYKKDALLLASYTKMGLGKSKDCARYTQQMDEMNTRKQILLKPTEELQMLDMKAYSFREIGNLPTAVNAERRGIQLTLEVPGQIDYAYRLHSYLLKDEKSLNKQYDPRKDNEKVLEVLDHNLDSSNAFAAASSVRNATAELYSFAEWKNIKLFLLGARDVFKSHGVYTRAVQELVATALLDYMPDPLQYTTSQLEMIKEDFLDLLPVTSQAEMKKSAPLTQLALRIALLLAQREHINEAIAFCERMEKYWKAGGKGYSTEASTFAQQIKTITEAKHLSPSAQAVQQKK